MKTNILKFLTSLLILLSFWAGGTAQAQSEPSLNQIYATAQSGKLDEAQTMVQQVLIMHPKSAKAFFVQAELYARQGRLDRARESLNMAQQYAPGLPFAKPEAVQALRSQLMTRPQTRTAADSVVSHAAAPDAGPSSSAWLLPLLLAGAVIAAGYVMFRRRSPQVMAPSGYASHGGLAGPQSFGMGAGTMAPQAAYPQAYPQPAGTGLGGRIMGGVATGLAVGAGVVAAEAIGRSLMGHPNAAPTADSYGGNAFDPMAQNADMGGANFGIADGAWDDGQAADFGGSSDWDN